MEKRVLVINGHPRVRSYCDAVVAAYLKGIKAVTKQVRLIVVRDLKFDPNLPEAHYKLPPMEPDLVSAVGDITWANHIALVYPVWWGRMPAILKGFIDRVFLPEFAYRIIERPPFWIPLLTGRSAHIILTMDTPRKQMRHQFRDCAKYAVQKVVFEMCGFKPVRVTTLSPVVPATHAKRRRWLHEVGRLAARS